MELITVEDAMNHFVSREKINLICNFTVVIYYDNYTGSWTKWSFDVLHGVSREKL